MYMLKSVFIPVIIYNLLPDMFYQLLEGGSDDERAKTAEIINKGFIE